jgi:hypothetical protein
MSPAWRALHVGTVKINNVFGGASEPRRASGNGFGFGPELLDEMTAVKVHCRHQLPSQLTINVSRH